MQSTNHVFIIGLGYIGLRIARTELARNHPVSTLARSTASETLARHCGATPIAGDLDDGSTLTNLPTKNTTLYFLAPPSRDGETDPRMRTFLQSLNQDNVPSVVVYISTTGVYGDSQGAWVTETTPTKPTQARSKRRLDAEQALHQWAKKHPQTRCIILRIAGIYGPNKLPIERLKRGEPLVDDTTKPAYINLIHADDLVQCCLAAADRGPANAVYNVCDGNPTTMMRYFCTIAKFANLPPPPAITMEEARHRITPGMLSYLCESKRLNNNKLITELNIQLRYPSYQNGIAAIFNHP